MPSRNEWFGREMAARKCRCASASHGHKPGECRNLATEPDQMCNRCHDKATKEISSLKHHADHFLVFPNANRNRALSCRLRVRMRLDYDSRAPRPLRPARHKCRRSGLILAGCVASSAGTPERVPGHSCFRLDSRGTRQHEMGASVAVGHWRRNVRDQYPDFHAPH